MAAVTTRRRFNRSEKVALYLASDGKCSDCGEALSPGWHGDHIEAWSRDGATDVMNGQALCRKCNLQKGDRVVDEDREAVPGWPAGQKPRDWQQDFVRVLRQLPALRQDFLLEACPGAGKTKAALAVARMWLDEGFVKRLLVVCPSIHLKKQWAQAAAQFGISLNYKFLPENGQEAADEQGIVATYSGVSGYPQTYRRQLQRDTFAIVDEAHHAGVEPLDGGLKRNLPWAHGLIEGLLPAKFILSTTGTPFRTDGFELPFVKYNPSVGGGGVTKPDYQYPYGRALDDHVCRQIFFPEYEGKVSWEHRGEIHDGYLTENCPTKEESNLIRQAVNPDGDWIKARLKEAHERLVALRRTGGHRAGGMVVAMDQDHARRLADLLRDKKVAGVEPKIAVSDDPGAADVITRFEQSDDPWLISVRMVSEGVDIPRLRVGVYASNWLTWLYFLQVCGRFWRYEKDLGRNQAAWLSVPNTKSLVDYASRIMEIREHHLSREREKRPPHPCHCGAPPPPQERARFISASSGHAVRVHVNGNEYLEAEVQRAQERARELFDDPDFQIPQANLEKLIAYLRETEGPLGAEAQPETDDITVTKAALSKRLGKMYWEYACVLAPDGSAPSSTVLAGRRRRIAQEVDGELRLQTDGKPNLASTVEHLRWRIKTMGLRLAGMGDANDSA